MKISWDELGLTPREAEVYKAVAKHGQSPVSDIANDVTIDRSSCYYQLQNLTDKNLVTELTINGTKHYEPMDIEALHEHIDIEAERKHRAADQLTELLTTETKPTPSIKVYTDYAGFRTFFDHLLDANPPLLRAYLTDDILDYLPHFHEKFRKRRSAANIPIKTIAENTERMQRIKELDDEEQRTTALTNDYFNDTTILKYILPASIAYLYCDDDQQKAVWLNDHDYADAEQSMFNDLWEELTTQK